MVTALQSDGNPYVNPLQDLAHRNPYVNHLQHLVHRIAK